MSLHSADSGQREQSPTTELEDGSGGGGTPWTWWTCASCNNQDINGKHKTSHSQASDSPHRRL